MIIQKSSCFFCKASCILEAYCLVSMALEGILKQTILKELLYYHMRPCVFLFAKIRKGPAQTCGVFILGHLKKFIFRYDSQIVWGLLFPIQDIVLDFNTGHWETNCVTNRRTLGN